MSRLHLWYALSSDLSEAERDTAYRLLSPDEQARHDRLRVAGPRHDFLAAHVLLRNVLAGYLSAEPAAIEFVTGEHGKPALAVAGAVIPKLTFNLSHTRGLAVVAVSPEGCEVGVDAEDLTRPIDLAAMRSYLAEPERADLEAEADARRAARFYSLWTLKEAYAKARGLGLKLPLTSFSFGLELAGGEVQGPVRFTPPADDPRGWKFHLLHTASGHALAATVEAGDDAPLEVTVWRTTPMRRLAPPDVRPTS